MNLVVTWFLCLQIIAPARMCTCTNVWSFWITQDPIIHCFLDTVWLGVTLTASYISRSWNYFRLAAWLVVNRFFKRQDDNKWQGLFLEAWYIYIYSYTCFFFFFFFCNFFFSFLTCMKMLNYTDCYMLLVC